MFALRRPIYDVLGLAKEANRLLWPRNSYVFVFRMRVARWVLRGQVTRTRFHVGPRGACQRFRWLWEI